jgi:hypothetical protein
MVKRYLEENIEAQYMVRRPLWLSKDLNWKWYHKHIVVNNFKQKHLDLPIEAT